MKDSIVESVISKFEQRSKVGQDKYGTTLDRTDLNFQDWLNHAQEEAMDFILYLEKLKQESEMTESDKIALLEHKLQLEKNKTAKLKKFVDLLANGITLFWAEGESTDKDGNRLTKVISNAIEYLKTI